jgi:hypothetical protein
MRALPLIFLVLGVVFLTIGIIASQTVTESVFESFKGRYTWNTMYYIIGGIALIIAAGSYFFNPKAK